MLPILFRMQLGGAEFAVGAYSTFMLLAWTAVVVLGTTTAVRRGIPWRRALAVFGGALAAALVGGRLLDLLVVAGFYAQRPSRLVALNMQGFSLYGALLAGAAAAALIAAAMRLPVWRLADCAAPALGAGIALMRVGCFLRGCCFGLPTTLPWGVTFPPGSPAWSHQFVNGTTGILGALAGRVLPVHPTQLYELAAAVLLGVTAWLLLRRGLPDGVAFLAFGLGFTLFRLGDHFLRAPVTGASVPAWFYPVFYAGILAVLAGLLAWRLGRKPPRG